MPMIKFQVFTDYEYFIFDELTHNVSRFYLNSFPPNDTIVLWYHHGLHKLMGIYMGSLILGAILPYMICVSFSWVVKS